MRVSYRVGVGMGVSVEASNADGVTAGVARGLDSLCRHCQHLKEQEDHCMQLCYSLGQHTCIYLFA